MLAGQKSPKNLTQVASLALGLFVVVPALSSGAVVITNVSVIPGGLALSGTGGSSGATYHLLASPTLATPSTNWPAVATNSFDASGNFILTNPISGIGEQFFRLRIPAVVPPVMPDFSMIGFATLSGFSSNNTLLTGGTTGGAAGPIVVASNLTWLVNYAQRSNQALRVLITADMDLSSLNNNDDNTFPGYPVGKITVNSHKTLYSTNGATISRGSLHVNSGKQNVIIRNLKFRDMFQIEAGDPGFDNHDWDYIRVNAGHHVWVDHCDFERVYDGMVDVKSGGDYVTVSWCVFSNQKKCSLIGSSDSTTSDRSHLNVTYHHNWFINVDERTPRMRFGNAHAFNQYTDNSTATNNTGKCIQATAEAAVLVENVFITHATNAFPTVFVNGGLQGNFLKVTGSVITNSPGNSGFQQLNAATFSFNAPWVTNAPPYPYTLDSVADVPSIVTNWAGIGKITSY